jgi:hypothetical protein
MILGNFRKKIIKFEVSTGERLVTSFGQRLKREISVFQQFQN